MSSLKTAVGLCIQELGGTKTGCSSGSNGIPAFSATKELIASTAPATNGDITVTFAGDVGAGVNGTTIVMVSSIGASNVTWVNTSNATSATAKELIEKNN